jgi:toxin ParE1/3/4
VSRIRRRPSPNEDLVAIFRHYAREAGIQVADRFFTEAEATFARLASMPGTGTLYSPTEPLCADLRYSPVSRFRNYVVFYRPVDGGIEVIRVLHGARDIDNILADELGINDDAGGRDEGATESD